MCRPCKIFFIMITKEARKITNSIDYLVAPSIKILARAKEKTMDDGD